MGVLEGVDNGKLNNSTLLNSLGTNLKSFYMIMGCRSRLDGSRPLKVGYMARSLNANWDFLGYNNYFWEEITTGLDLGGPGEGFAWWAKCSWTSGEYF